MKGPTGLIGGIVLVLLCAAVVLCCAQESMARLDRISVSVSGGAGHLPLSDWEEFASISSSHFEKDKLGTYLDFRVAYHLTNKHALALNVESIRTSATLHFNLVDYTSPLDPQTAVNDWDFRAIPIGISYEFYPRSVEEKVSPFFGAGASYFFSEVKDKSWFLNEGVFEDLGSEGTRDGEGYGLHAYVGVQSQLTDYLLVVSRVRARYADGMAFTDKKEDVKVEFTGVDFTLGLGWRF
jgi:outer membrane protein W